MKKTFLIFLGLSVTVLLTGCTESSIEIPGDKTTQVQQIDESDEYFVFSEKEFDFGVIKQSSEKVSHDFKFTYYGEEPIEIIGVPTSCACASAKVDKTKFNPGESGILTVKFNPNLHAEPKGKFFKTILFFTDPKLTTMPEIKIWAEINLDLGPKAFELKFDHDEEGEDEAKGLTSYISVTSEKFATMLAGKDFVLVDVHIPEQEHISGTDLLIPYNKIEQNLDKLPTDKSAKIVVYCRSGGMSRAAAYQLEEEGYTNVFDLVGGKQAYDEFLKSTDQITDLTAFQKTGYIDFEATVITKTNLEKVNTKLNDKLTETDLDPEKTLILLGLNNHRDDLVAFNYQKLTTLDGEPPEKWQLFSSAMGGHHVIGILTFPYIEKPPQFLTITGLPVGETTLTFNSIVK